MNGYSDVNGTCQVCNYPCDQCNIDGTCQTCNIQYYALIPTNGVCILQTVTNCIQY